MLVVCLYACAHVCVYVRSRTVLFLLLLLHTWTGPKYKGGPKDQANPTTYSRILEIGSQAPRA